MRSKERDETSFLSKIPDSVKVAILRWWLAGAMYFMLGWGLGLSDLDGIFIIGIVIGVGHIFVLHPLVYSMFDIKRNGKIINKKYYDRTILEGTWIKLSEILKSLLATFVAALMYSWINSLVSFVFKYDGDLFKGAEPISFGIFFVIIYVLLTLISNQIYKLIDHVKKKKVVNQENNKNKEKSSEQ